MIDFFQCSGNSYIGDKSINFQYLSDNSNSSSNNNKIVTYFHQLWNCTY